MEQRHNTPHFSAWHQAQGYARDHAEQAVAADRQREQMRLVLAAAAPQHALRVDQGEGFNIADKRAHSQAATVDVRRQAATKAKRIGAGLLLANAPLSACLFKVIDQCGPLDACFHFN